MQRSQKLNARQAARRTTLVRGRDALPESICVPSHSSHYHLSSSRPRAQCKHPSSFLEPSTSALSALVSHKVWFAAENIRVAMIPH
ncbi:hypothetical protein E2C01_023891 [Portunus trituberculatus]|uniref:Uncharacterized protein n=1 Tax=Portunus trituberculatus TaxID=210409 RepID=A0A5B7ECX1_PORTR|nr:hypothetical protein [Portunus trituberculatus]